MGGALTTTLEPLAIIQRVTKARVAGIAQEFIYIIKKLYQYEVLKFFLDFTTSVAHDGRLTFELYDQQDFELDLGNCKTIENATNSLFNRFRRRNLYNITIKKVSPDVVLHEIAHMVDKELNLRLHEGYSNAVFLDIENPNTKNAHLKSVIDDIMIRQVANYPKSHHFAELFARYFEIISLSKEVIGKYKSSGFTLSEVISTFQNTHKWLSKNAYPSMKKETNPLIAAGSKKYIVPIEKIKHNWSEEKVKSFHNRSDNSQKKWGSSIKPIHKP